MNAEKEKPGSICLLPNLQGVGGPASFRARITAGLQLRGIETHSDPDRGDTQTILVIAGTRQLSDLRAARKRGVRIVQRLDGINWTHKRVHTGLRHYVKAETANWLLQTIRSRLTDFIVYQSQFTHDWWLEKYGKTHSGDTVIYNGVDLSVYTSEKGVKPPSDRIRILVVEGHLGGGHELGFENAVRFALALKAASAQPLELVVAGDTPRELVERYQARGIDWIEWKGVLPRQQVAGLYRTAHLFMPCEIHAACPNAVIEAMASGLPVVCFDTGALKELVGQGAGWVAPYGADDDRMQPAVVDPLVQGALQVLAKQNEFRRAARQRAEQKFRVENMVDQYFRVLMP
jgi:glycosyltransferase involved in cell wall biosynthesis